MYIPLKFPKCATEMYIHLSMTGLIKGVFLINHELLYRVDCPFRRYGFGHVAFNEVCMYIPALFMGPKVKNGYQITNYTTDKDFAPTALNALGLQPGKYMVGNVVEEIYQ